MIGFSSIDESTIREKLKINIKLLKSSVVVWDEPKERWFNENTYWNEIHVWSIVDKIFFVDVWTKLQIIII